MKNRLSLKARIDSLPPLLLFVLRVALGITLQFKGISFLSHYQDLEHIIDESYFQAGSEILTHYIAYASLLGGLFIMIGLFTRICCLAQIPILFGAVFFVNIPHSAFDVQGGEWVLSIIVFVFLIFFTIEGSGPYSVRRLSRREAL